MAMKPANMIISGYLIASSQFDEDQELPANWHWGTAPEPVAGNQYITLDNGKTWHSTIDRGFGRATYVKPAPLTLGQFRDRFTFAERIAIDNAPDNPALPIDVRWMMKTMNVDFMTSKHIELDHVQTIIGVRTIEGLGLIEPGRADQILSNA